MVPAAVEEPAATTWPVEVTARSVNSCVSARPWRANALRRARRRVAHHHAVHAGRGGHGVAAHVDTSARAQGERVRERGHPLGAAVAPLPEPLAAGREAHRHRCGREPGERLLLEAGHVDAAVFGGDEPFRPAVAVALDARAAHAPRPADGARRRPAPDDPDGVALRVGPRGDDGHVAATIHAHAGDVGVIARFVVGPLPDELAGRGRAFEQDELHVRHGDLGAPDRVDDTPGAACHEVGMVVQVAGAVPASSSTSACRRQSGSGSDLRCRTLPSESRRRRWRRR